MNTHQPHRLAVLFLALSTVGFACGRGSASVSTGASAETAGAETHGVCTGTEAAAGAPGCDDDATAADSTSGAD
jgi:hypothetical protein